MRSEDLLWTSDRLAEAFAAAVGEPNGSWPTVSGQPESVVEQLDEWSPLTGFEVEPVEAPDVDIPAMVAGAAPAVLELGINGDQRYVVLRSRARRGRVHVVGPDGRTRAVSVDALIRVVRADVDALRRPAIDRLLSELGLDGASGDRVARRLLADRPAVLKGWILRKASANGFWPQLEDSQVGWQTAAFVACHATNRGLALLAWWILGRGVLMGRIDGAWIGGWIVATATCVPLTVVVAWLQGRVSVSMGALLRRQLLQGVLRGVSADFSREGHGRLLSRVIESEALQSVALSGTFAALTAVIEIVLAGGVIALGAAGRFGVILFASWVALAAVLFARRARRQTRWTERRLQMTNELVEAIVGYRTRKVQGISETMSVDGSGLLAEYHARARDLDSAATLLDTTIPRGWLALGLVGLLPAMLGSSASTGALAVGVGGVLLGARALSRLVEGASQLIAAKIAWEQVAGMFRTATSAARPGAMIGSGPVLSEHRTLPVLEANGLTFGYPGRGRPILENCDLRVEPGERVLLTGSSGAGKSTLASIITGLQASQAGTVLLHGLDPNTWGSRRWRRRVVAIPQFHDNHVFSSSLAFNLLMGKCWPPSPRALARADAVCRELGLGALIDRMPSGLQQPVGEAGWQMSHGERSRVFMARAILQGADLAVFDETFASLDIGNLETTIDYAIAELGTVVVIAHP